MNGKNAGTAMLPHPRKIFRAARILAAMVFLIFGFVGVFYPAIIPSEIISIVPQELFSVTRENIILISAFVSMILGFVLLAMKEKF